MNKNFIYGLLAVALSAGITFAGTTTTAPSTSASSEKKGATKTAALVCEGTISSVSNEQLIVNAVGGKTDTLTVNAATAVKKAGKAAKIDELNIGAEVKVFYKKDGTKLVATKIVEKAAATPAGVTK